METNLFNSTGSKFNSEIERFKILAIETKKNSFEFTWIANGKGLKTQKEKLKSFFEKHKLFNLYTFEDFLKTETIK